MKDSLVFVAAVLVLALFIVVAALLIRPAFESPTVVYKEAPLQKNAQLNLSPGSAFRYTLVMNQSWANATYLIGQTDNCTLIRMMESVNFSGVCLDSDGLEEGGSNATLMNPAIVMFQPWMLALSDGWTWNNTMYLSFNGDLKEVQQNQYRVVRMENYSGIMAYVVELTTDDGPPEYMWVDAQRRILLKMTGEDYQILLTWEGTQDELLGINDTDAG